MRLMLMFCGMVAACSGCGPVGDQTPLPGQAEAVRIIWEDTYHQVQSPPVIYWRRDTCNQPNGIYGTLPWCTFMDGNTRVAGLEAPGWVEVGAPSTEADHLWETSLSHELLHAAFRLAGVPNGDPGHTSPEWFTGDRPSKPHEAIQAIKAAGL